MSLPAGFFRGLIVTVAFVVFPCFVYAASSGMDPAALYQRHCAVCHGDHGDGNTRARNGLSPPPRDFTVPEAAQELTRERMIASVTYGRPGTAMMPFHGRLSEQEIAVLVDHIRKTYMAAVQTGADSGALARGKAVYRHHCAVCHGDKGSGAMWTQTSLNPPPRDFTAAETRAVLTRERMVMSVTYGRPGTAMMSFRKRLSGEEIGAVVDYIRATFITAAAAPTDEGTAISPPGHPPVSRLTPPASAAPPQPVDMSLSFPNGLKGDYAQGREFYLSNCFTCHGKEGNGEGPRAKFIEPRPRNFLGDDARTRLNRPTLFMAIQKGLPGTVMPAWGKVLDDQQIANVAEYVFQAYIHPVTDKKKLNTP